MPVGDTNDLIGTGFSAQQTEVIGGTVSKVNGAAATLQTGAAIIMSRNTELNPAAVTTNSFIMPSNARVMSPYFLVNSSATPGFVWVPSGHTLVSGGATTANGSVSVGASASLIIWQYKPKFWSSK